MHNVTIREHIKGRKVFSFSTMVYGDRQEEHNYQQYKKDEITGKLRPINLMDDEYLDSALIPPKIAPYKPPDEERSRTVSLSRTVQKINDIVYSNEWEYFITITLDKERIDRYNYEEIRQRIAKHLQNIKARKAPQLEYVIVPELHQDGAFHFHGLLRNTGRIRFEDSGRTDPSSRSHVFNMPDFSYGFNTATVVRDTQRTATYIGKYITKSLNEALPPNAKRYWCSRGADKTVKNKLYLTYDEIAFLKECIKKETVSAKTVSVDNGAVKFEVEYIITQEKEVDNSLISDIS